MTRTPPIAFTEDNFCAVISGLKTETRRLSNGNDKPRYSIGDRCYLAKPTQVLAGADDKNEKLHIQYFWHDSVPKWISPTSDDLIKITSRKTGIYSKQIARFMLKSFARYWVEIIDVQRERLMDITDEGAIAEGIKSEEWYSLRYFDYMAEVYACQSPIDSHLSEFAAIHKPSKDKLGEYDLVDSNPTVWVYKFKFLKIAS